MTIKRAVTSFLFGVLCFMMPLTAHAATKDIATVDYDKELSLVTITPKKDGVTTFSYKINGEYPKYQYDKVLYFDENGNLTDTKEGMLNQPIFSDDPTTWIDISKDKVSVPPDSEYYEKMREGDAELVLPYTVDNPDHIFYIPIENHNSSVDVIIANGEDTQEIFLDTKIEKNPLKADVESVSKKNKKETVQISGENISYVEYERERYEVKDNKVKIDLTSNGEKKFIVYGVDDGDFDILSYTVEGLKEDTTDEDFDKEFESIDDKKLDTKAPVITVDSIPSKDQISPLTFKVHTDEKCIITCNGESVTGAEMELTVDSNCSLTVSAVDMSGNYTNKVIEISCFSSQQHGYTLDRDNYWTDNNNTDTAVINDETGRTDTASSSMSQLPKTGGVTLNVVLVIAALLISTGIFILRRKKYDKN